MALTDEQALEFIRRSKAAKVPEERIKELLRQELTRPDLDVSGFAELNQPAIEALSQARELRPMTTRQKIRGDIQEAFRQVAAPAAEVGLPLATALLTRGTGALAAGALQAAAAGTGNLLGQAIRQPQQPASLAQAALPAATAGLATAATAGLGQGFTRAGGVGKTATAEVTQRGVIGGAQLGFGALAPEAESRTIDAIRRFVQRPPLTGGRAEVNQIIKDATARGVAVPVQPLLDRLRNALGAVDPATGDPLTVGPEKLAAQRRINTLAARLEQEAQRSGGSLPVARFEQILSREITKPTVRAGGKMEPSLQESEYVRALGRVKRATIQDVAAALGTEGSRFLRARLAARREITALENLRRRLFRRDRAGNLRPKDGAIPTVRSIFTRAEQGDDTLLRIFEEFDETTGADITPHLREMSLKRELTSADRENLIVVDGVVRSLVGLRSGAAELARAGSRGFGKMLQIGARPLGAAAGIAAQKATEQPMSGIDQEVERLMQRTRKHGFFSTPRRIRM